MNASAGIIFYLQHYSRPFLEKYYLPCVGLVLLTSVSFFVPPKMVPGRGGMLVTLFLVLNNIFSAFKVCKRISKLIENYLTKVWLIFWFRMKFQYQEVQQLWQHTSWDARFLRSWLWCIMESFFSPLGSQRKLWTKSRRQVQLTLKIPSQD